VAGYGDEPQKEQEKEIDEWKPLLLVWRLCRSVKKYVKEKVNVTYFAVTDHSTSTKASGGALSTHHTMNETPNGPGI